jgi:hypothetical protein
VNIYEKRKAGLLGHEIRRNTHVVKKIELFNNIVESIDKLPSNTVNDKKKLQKNGLMGLIYLEEISIINHLYFNV